MNDTQHHIWEMMEKIGTCMLITWDGEKQRARPMAAYVREKEHAVYFLTDERQEKAAQIEQFPVVTLAFSDTGGAKYVSLSGHATVSNDRAKIKELWNPFAKAFWDSAEDPNIRVLKIAPEDAEMWDTPGKLVSTVKMLVAAATDTRPDMGKNEKVSM